MALVIRSGKILLRFLPFTIAFILYLTSLLYIWRSNPAGSQTELNLKTNTESNGVVRLLSYSGFLATWGPGPEIAKRFKTKTGYNLQFFDAGDAGLILKKTDLFPSDVVVGLDGLSIKEAKLVTKWKRIEWAKQLVEKLNSRIPLSKWAGEEGEFIPYDWSQMTFIYRRGEISPPISLQDLLDPRFKGLIAIQDPRTSTPGLQFLLWVLAEFGAEEGFKYLEKLRPNLFLVGSSWSQAYGAFSKKQAALVFSYVTSPVYHWIEDKDFSYQSAVFESGHPIQVEHMAIPENCINCVGAERFVQFMLEPEIQSLIMQKNFMLPLDSSVTTGSPFEKITQLPIHQGDLKAIEKSLDNRKLHLEKWRKMGL